MNEIEQLINDEAIDIYESFFAITKKDAEAKKCSIVCCNMMIREVLVYFDNKHPDYSYWLNVRRKVSSI